MLGLSSHRSVSTYFFCPTVEEGQYISLVISAWKGQRGREKKELGRKEKRSRQSGQNFFFVSLEGQFFTNGGGGGGRARHSRHTGVNRDATLQASAAQSTATDGTRGVTTVIIAVLVIIVVITIIMVVSLVCGFFHGGIRQDRGEWLNLGHGNRGDRCGRLVSHVS